MKFSNTLDKTDVDKLKEKIKDIYDANMSIHLSIKQKHKREIFAEAKITGMYENFFSVSSQVGSYTESFTITYISVLTKSIKILELNE